MLHPWPRQCPPDPPPVCSLLCQLSWAPAWDKAQVPKTLSLMTTGHTADLRGPRLTWARMTLGRTITREATDGPGPSSLLRGAEGGGGKGGHHVTSVQKITQKHPGGGEVQVPAQSPFDNSEGPWLGRALACGAHPQLTCHATASWEISRPDMPSVSCAISEHFFP